MHLMLSARESNLKSLTPRAMLLLLRQTAGHYAAQYELGTRRTV